MHRFTWIQPFFLNKRADNRQLLKTFKLILAYT